MKMRSLLHGADLGHGYSSVGLFDFAGRKFAMVYIDANNMLPGFRNSVIKRIKERYGIDSEIYTTDTHSIIRSITGVIAVGFVCLPSTFFADIAIELFSI